MQMQTPNLGVKREKSLFTTNLKVFKYKLYLSIWKYLFMWKQVLQTSISYPFFFIFITSLLNQIIITISPGNTVPGASSVPGLNVPFAGYQEGRPGVYQLTLLWAPPVSVIAQVFA